MAIIKKNGNWWVDIYVNGQRVRRKVGPNKRTAELAEKKLKTDAAQGKWLGIQQISRLTFKKFYETKFSPRLRRAPLTVRNYEKNAKLYFIPTFGNKPLDKITTEQVEDYVALRSADAAPGTIMLELAQLKAILNAAIRWGLLTKNPAKSVKVERMPEAQIHALTEEETERLYTVAKQGKDWFYPFIVVALNTGMRIGEILNLTWENVDFRRRQIAVVNDENFTTKSGKNRYIPMNDLLKDVLSSHPRHITNPYIFPSIYQEKRANLPLHADVPRNRLKIALKEAGLSTAFRVHDLRHTFGTRLAEKGVDPRSIMELMGHSNVSMTMRYLHTNASRLMDAVGRLEREAKPQTTVQDATG